MARDDVVVGGDPLEEVSVDVVVAAVMGQLQDVDVQLSLVGQASSVDRLEDLVSACVSGQQDRLVGGLEEADDAGEVED